MATMNEIQAALKILLGAGLRGSPAKDQLSDIVESWLGLLKDVPAEALTQAARDVAMTDEFWPSVRRIREAAYQVQTHNFQSAAPNPWKDESHTKKYFDGIAVVIDRHYYCFESDSAKPPKPREIIFSPEVDAELQEFEKRTGGIYGQAEYDRIHELTYLTLHKLGRM